jgi:uncharacterized protein (DUF2235 family)
MKKTIIFCADGTWNGPQQDEDNDNVPDYTNVFKLFYLLAGHDTLETICLANEQEKVFYENNQLKQIAKYIHGVGDSQSSIMKILGGAFGMGILARIVRGYTFISRNYNPGDDIIILGFSRGAYTARALAGMIAWRGLLSKPLTVDKGKAYKLGANAWSQYRKAFARKTGILAKFIEDNPLLPGFLFKRKLKDADFVHVDHITAVGVWDTVGALGIPLYNSKKFDIFRFSDQVLSNKVKHGFHAIALDEQRTDFSPTHWEYADNVVEMLFPGAHADVGGGYSPDNDESGLSDLSLNWMMDKLKDESVGVRFMSFNKQKQEPRYLQIVPNPLGCAHQPWLHGIFRRRKQQLRDFSGLAIGIHDGVRERMQGGNVMHEPGTPPAPYVPGNLPLC